MHRAFLISLLITLSACASNQPRSHEALMDEIESSITLPPEALPLQSYARYYTEYRGSVHGAYTTEIEEQRTSHGCEEAQPDSSYKPVVCPAAADVRPGSRRWVKFEDYPAVVGRDCTALQIEFDPKSRTFIYLECSEVNTD